MIFVYYNNKSKARALYPFFHRCIIVYNAFPALYHYIYYIHYIFSFIPLYLSLSPLLLQYPFIYPISLFIYCKTFLYILFYRIYCKTSTLARSVHDMQYIERPEPMRDRERAAALAVTVACFVYIIYNYSNKKSGRGYFSSQKARKETRKALYTSPSDLVLWWLCGVEEKFWKVIWAEKVEKGSVFGWGWAWGRVSK